MVITKQNLYFKFRTEKFKRVVKSWGRSVADQARSVTGADPGFFLGRGAHSFLFVLQNTSCIRKQPGHLRGRGECAPPSPSP